jgi:hypothetical protein
MALRSAALSGRKELLAWLNNLCNSAYPSVESLRDGAAYCTIIEAAISRIAQNCAATHSSEASMANSRAEQARIYLSKVDWSATAFVCEGGDPSLDPMPVRAACAHNMQLLQDLLHNCIPIEHRYSVEANRLASGKLQDHILLLRWLYAFMSKVLAHYSRKALKKKGELVAGAVEGVKLNRTALLRSNQVNGVADRGGLSPAQPREQEAMHKFGPHSQYTDAARGVSNHSLPNGPSPPPQFSQPKVTESLRSPSNDFRVEQSSRPHTQRDDSEESLTKARSTGTSAAKAAAITNAADEVLREKVVHSHYTRGTIAIPQHFRETLVSLRNEVEEVEAIVLYVQEQHNYYLTRPNGGTAAYTPSAAVRSVERESQYKLDPYDTLSLEELGALLEERDALAQQYAALDAVVTAAHCRAQEAGKAMSPLLRDISDLLHPE